jgi:hypothetical protein
MINNRLFYAVVLLAGLAEAQAATAASPIVIVNQGQSNECQITPSSSTVFTLSTEGNVLINGSYTSGTCSTGGTGGGGSGNPTFSFSPNPADLTIPSNSLPSTGGTVNPNFVAYFANTCTGSVTPGAGCTAVSGNWANGTVCTYTTNAAGQKYCTPNSAAVTMPANSANTACTYTFQATNCTNGSTSVSSSTATVTVAAAGNNNVPCSPTDMGDLPGYTRQCSGNATNAHGAVAWDNTFATLFGAPWPGATWQPGHAWTVTVNATQFASFKIDTGTAAAGIHIYFNNSFGQTGTASVSTQPGHFLDGICLAGSSLFISSKPGTTAACKLSANTTYYLNISMASLYPPDYASACAGSACTTGWSFDSYGN